MHRSEVVPFVKVLLSGSLQVAVGVAEVELYLPEEIVAGELLLLLATLHPELHPFVRGRYPAPGLRALATDWELGVKDPIRNSDIVRLIPRSRG
jgi:hypothetical protein